ncbi:hypothetical protein [Pararhizobium sp. PWRC1-1]|uniref:hypothetical protein n=1 Tax=Pararhizobium sp. PWRC1-1 TaxID=2804566 RepID=UPI003CF2B97B
MASCETKGPTLTVIRARASECGIEIAAEREASILAGAQYLHDAARRLDKIAILDDARPEPVQR